MATCQRYWKPKRRDVRYSWRIVFRPVGSVDGNDRRRVCVPPESLSYVKPTDTEQKARQAVLSLANECDDICRLIELNPRPDLIERGLKIGALTEAEADALKAGKKIIRVAGSAQIAEAAHVSPKKRPITPVLTAAEACPSSQTEMAEDPESAKKHRAAIMEFVRFSGVNDIAKVRVDHITAWLESLKSRGLSYDGRRHKLLWLKRACFMAPSFGCLNVLPRGLKLDKRTKKRIGAGDVWSLSELCEAAVFFIRTGDARRLAALALGGFMGLRNSEIARAKVGDVRPFMDGYTLSIGERQFKTENSVRELPVPICVFEFIKPLVSSRPPDSAIIEPISQYAHFSENNFGRWFRERMRNATQKQLPTKHLRKSFSTWTIRAGLPVRHSERYTGHVSSVSGATVERHYLGQADVLELRETARKMDGLISAGIKAAQANNKNGNEN